MKETAGIVTIILSLVGYIPYLRDVIKGKTKPHTFSWLIWLIITLIVGIAQLSAGAGWGALHNITTGLACVVILYYALKNKDKDITVSDKIMFGLSLLSIPLWVFTKDPLWSIILLTFIDIFAFGPTIRKTWSKPFSETLSSYSIAGTKYFIALFALSVYKLSTLLYPSVLVCMNFFLVFIMLWRRNIKGYIKEAE